MALHSLPAARRGTPLRCGSIDGLVLPHGAAGVKLPGSQLDVLNFISHQHRHPDRQAGASRR
jgi:hypothetical protein